MGNQQNHVITVATWAFAVCLGIIVVTLAIIVIRDGSTPLVSQAMGELLWLGGICIAVLAGLLGFTKYMDAAGQPAAAIAGAAQPGVSVPAGLSSVGDVQTILAGLLASAQTPTAASADVPTVPVVPASTVMAGAA